MHANGGGDTAVVLGAVLLANGFNSETNQDGDHGFDHAHARCVFDQKDVEVVEKSLDLAGIFIAFIWFQVCFSTILVHENSLHNHKLKLLFPPD